MLWLYKDITQLHTCSERAWGQSSWGLLGAEARRVWGGRVAGPRTCVRGRAGLPVPPKRACHALLARVLGMVRSASAKCPGWVFWCSWARCGRHWECQQETIHGTKRRINESGTHVLIIIIFLKIHTFLSKVHKNPTWSLFKAPGLYLLDSLHPDSKSGPSSDVLVRILSVLGMLFFFIFYHLRVSCLKNGKWWRRKLKCVCVGFFGLFVAPHRSWKDPADDKDVPKPHMGLCVLGIGSAVKTLWTSQPRPL